jgi:hypothetical protein
MASNAKKTRRVNGRSFRPGPDTRRHMFTTEERERGYQTAWHDRDINVIAWVFRNYVAQPVQAANGKWQHDPVVPHLFFSERNPLRTAFSLRAHRVLRRPVAAARLTC